MSTETSSPTSTASNPFDPLSEIAGLPRDADESTAASSAVTPKSSQTHPVHGYGQGRQGAGNHAVHMRPNVEQSTDDRVDAAKRFVAGGGGRVGGDGLGDNSQHAHTFGVTGANRHATLHPHLAQHQQQQYQYQQQRQVMMQMQMYNTMAAYNTVAAYSTRNANINAPQLTQQHNAIVPYNPAVNGMMITYPQQRHYQNTPDAPVMQPRTRPKMDPSEYRVQKRSPKDKFVSEDDKAFKPLFDEFKASFGSK